MAEEELTGKVPELSSLSSDSIEVEAPAPEQELKSTPESMPQAPKAAEKKTKSKKNKTAAGPPSGAMGIEPQHSEKKEPKENKFLDSRLKTAMWGNEKKRTVSTSGIFAALILVLAISGAYFTINGGITGFAVGEPTEHTYNFPEVYAANTESTLAFQKILGFSISGSLEGTGAVVKLKTPEREYLVANLSGSAAQTYTLTTDKGEYALGETATITITPDTTTKSVYAALGEENQILDSNTFIPNSTGNYTIFALITTNNDILRLEVPIIVVETPSETPAAPSVATASDSQAALKTFTNLCADSCVLQQEESNPTLIVELEPGSTLRLDAITTVEQTVNREPIQTRTFGNATIKTGDTLTLALADYFRDPEGNSITYDSSLSDGLTSEVSGDGLSIKGNIPGEYDYYVYASDGANLVTSNSFKVTVGDDLITRIGEVSATDPVPVDNTTDNTTQPIDVILPTDNTTSTTFTDCQDPNPNKRPLSCIEGNEDEYFTAKKIYLEDAGRNPVARMTAFGNLMIKGNLVQSAAGEPSSLNFRISRPTADLQGEINMAWIDDAGNLYLRGVLHEEQIDLVPSTTEAFLIQNAKGTTLGYFDRRTGALYLRGNLITGKADLE